MLKLTPPLSITHPQLAAEWHPTRNYPLTPDDVTAGSQKKVWWQCPLGEDHEFQAVIANRSRQPICPVCLNKIAVRSNCLAILFPEIATQWHPTKNGDLTPHDVVPGSGKSAHWLCPTGQEDHVWSAVVASRTRKNGSGCPFCAGKSVTKSNCANTTHPERAAMLDNPMNNAISGDSVVAGSKKKAWFRCRSDETHYWKAEIRSVLIDENDCPYCAGKAVNEQNCLATTHPHLSNEWAGQETDRWKPGNVVAGSHRQLPWRCQEDPDHPIWHASVYSRAKGESGCPYCSNQAVCEKNSLAWTHPELAEEWDHDANLPLTPKTITAGNTKIVQWICRHNRSHRWKTSTIQRRGTSKRRGTGCPYCSNQISNRSTEVFQKIRETSPGLVSEKDCRLSRHLRIDGWPQSFDAALPSEKVLIEYDGNYWHEGKEDVDSRKTRCAHEQGYIVIRIREHPLGKITSNDIVCHQSDSPQKVAVLVIRRINLLKKSS